MAHKVERSRNISPFWRGRPSGTRHASSSKATESGIVVGASYSHTDILKFDSLYGELAIGASNSLTVRRSLAAAGSRPQTPPSSKGTSRIGQTPPTQSNSIGQSPTKRKNIAQKSFHNNGDWDVGYDELDENEAENNDYIYNEGADEDEFGLPSISSMRRAAQKRTPVNKVNDPGGGGAGSSKTAPIAPLTPDRMSGRPRANSSDIAEERGPPLYPNAKKKEGKILRPQYKDILRGMRHRLCGTLERTALMLGKIPQTRSIS